MNQLWIASDHAGFDLKQFLIQAFQSSDWIWHDLGPHTKETIDYPDMAYRLVQSLTKPLDKGVLICGTGIGMSIASNRYNHIRSAICRNPLDASLARRHNDANILCLGGRTTNEQIALEILKTFVNSPFDQGHHKARVESLGRLTP